MVLEACEFETPWTPERAHEWWAVHEPGAAAGRQSGGERVRVVYGGGATSQSQPPVTKACIPRHEHREVDVASVNMISEEEAVGRVREIYAEIRETLGIDFVPNMYKVMAPNPSYLEANWNKIKTVMKTPGRLDPLTKEIIAVAVSAVSGCRY